MTADVHRRLSPEASDGLHCFFDAAVYGLETGRTPTTLDEFLDYLWSKFSVQPFAITLDYVVAARTDPNLRGRVEKARKEHDRALDEIWGQFFTAGGDTEQEAKRKLNLTLSLFRGLGLQLLL